MFNVQNGIETDKAVKAYMAEHGVKDYLTALKAVIHEAQNGPEPKRYARDTVTEQIESLLNNRDLIIERAGSAVETLVKIRGVLPGTSRYAATLAAVLRDHPRLADAYNRGAVDPNDAETLSLLLPAIADEIGRRAAAGDIYSPVPMKSTPVVSGNSRGHGIFASLSNIDGPTLERARQIARSRGVDPAILSSEFLDCVNAARTYRRGNTKRY